MSLSTPGVVLPWFSVTRLTARALPLNEWVSKCCKAFTLPHLPSCVALTIRAWSRRTLLWAACQSMSCQPFTISWEAAPAGCSAVICFVSSIGLLSAFVMKDQMEVCPLSRGVILLVLNPYPSCYRAAFACSILLYLHSYRRPLQFAFPVGGRTGLPCFV